MDDNDKKNAWDSLIEDLGVQPDEAAFERHQPESQDLPPVVEPETVEFPAAEPSDWNSLAESLGLEVEEESVCEEPVADIEPVVVEPAAVETEAAAVEAEVVEAEPAGTDAFGGFLAEEIEGDDIEDDDIEDDDIEDDDIEDDDIEDDDIEDDDIEDDDIDDGVEVDEAIEDELPPLPNQIDQALNDSSWKEESEVSADTQSTERGAAEVGDASDDGITGDAARSAFDALFSDGSSDWGSAFLAPKRSDEKSSDEKPTVERPVFKDDLEPLAGEGEESADDEQEESERPKRKRSRRRRGGRGRKPAEERADDKRDGVEDKEVEATEVGCGDAEGDEESTGDKKRRRRRRSRGRSRRPEGGEGVERDSELEDGEESLEQPRSRRTKHRNIPTWSDAIGMIVDANLEQREKSPSRPKSSRGRGGRGGRGGRRRKKSENNK